MTDDLTGPDLLARARAIGLPLRVVAAEAGLDKHTVYRLRKRSDRVEARTLRKVHQVLESHERALLMSLIKRHPDCLRHAGEAAA